MTLDLLIHLIEALGVIGTGLGFGWGILRKLTRIVDALEEYPPHRHSNGRILYPKHFSPGMVEGRQSSE